jgi:hypothetical protein
MLEQDDYLYLVRLTESYLEDAGFAKELYRIITYKDTGFIEVIFTHSDAIDYIIDDIQKTDYSKLLRIKKYINEDKTISAIFTYYEIY